MYTQPCKQISVDLEMMMNLPKSASTMVGNYHSFKYL